MSFGSSTKYSFEIPDLVLSTMPSGSTRLTVTFLYSFPSIALKSSATAMDAKHAIKKARIFILFSLRKSQASVLSAYGMSYKIFPGRSLKSSKPDNPAPIRDNVRSWPHFEVRTKTRKARQRLHLHSLDSHRVDRRVHRLHTLSQTVSEQPRSR